MTHDATHVCYCEKKNKAVTLLSSMHNDATIDESTSSKNKSEIVTFYNRTKIGADVLNQLCSNYDTARTTKRYLTAIFYNILNIASINALCIYSANKNYVKVKRAYFLDEISWQMVKPQIHERMKQSLVPRQLKIRGLVLLGKDSEEKNGNS
ncbi:uncharacterized protein LOC124716707 [Schistocerca piceifrons]|uniref:uncharacterized protein LOC124716707 n=1 Tax=Schistocerca piceifrons TaxID=274613 RepID=UPI001F5F8AC0|nr:uncharacterized protein LOC124716707 [Schistocerca piceifrons]